MTTTRQTMARTWGRVWVWLDGPLAVAATRCAWQRARTDPPRRHASRLASIAVLAVMGSVGSMVVVWAGSGPCPPNPDVLRGAAIGGGVSMAIAAVAAELMGLAWPVVRDAIDDRGQR